MSTGETQTTRRRPPTGGSGSNPAPPGGQKSSFGASLVPRSRWKLVFLGDENVGKSSIVTRFIFNKFSSSYSVTIGVDFVSRTMYLDDRIVRLQLWDTAGQERFRSLIPSYIRDASVAVVVYDTTSRASFRNTDSWIKEVRDERGSDVLIILVGNKIDLVDSREISAEEGAQKARSLGVMFVETSAKDGMNVVNLFRRLALALPSFQSNDGTSSNEAKSGAKKATTDDSGQQGDLVVTETPADQESDEIKVVNENREPQKPEEPSGSCC